MQKTMIQKILTAHMNKKKEKLIEYDKEYSGKKNEERLRVNYD